MLAAAAIAYVVVLWGISTAVIFYLDSLPTRTFRVSMAAATLVVAGCCLLVWLYRDDSTSSAVVISFGAALLVWGWTEMSLYMGYITGPRKHRCAHGCSGLAHFGHAVSANLWHELLVIACAVAIWLSGNETAAWCFVMLWLMHLSARLNVFLGVRNVSEEFVPAHMEVLKGFLRRRRMNPLFPFSVIALAGLTWYLAQLPQSISSVMAATLAAIGLLEHLLLMVPLPVGRLFHWSLSDYHKAARQDQPQKDLRHEKVRIHTLMGTLT
jgi:putative photosynthetic complex assembly protein 2